MNYDPIKNFQAFSLFSSFFLTIRAAEWQLDQPAWSGRMRITAKGNVAYIKLEDKNSGKEQASLG